MPLPTIRHLRFAAPPRRTGESLRKPKPTEKRRSRRPSGRTFSRPSRTGDSAKPPARARRAQTSGTLRRGGPPNLASGGRFDLPRAGGSYSKRLFVGEPTPPLHQFLSFRGPDRPGNGGPKTPSERGRSASTVPRNRGGHGTPWVGARSAPARPRPYRPSRRGEGGTGSFAPRRRSLSSKIPEPSHGGAGAPPRTALHDRFTWSEAETPDRTSLFSRDGTVPAIERTTNPPPPADRPFYGSHGGRRVPAHRTNDEPPPPDRSTLRERTGEGQTRRPAFAASGGTRGCASSPRCAGRSACRC